MGEADNPIMQAALDMAARGRRVFPCLPGDRPPAIEGWQAAATTDPAKIRQWWMGGPDLLIGFMKDGREVFANPAFNYGVPCGDGLLVADADVKKGKQGLKSAHMLDVTFDGFVVQTPSGGLHEYFEGPDVQNAVDVLGPNSGLDVRSARGFVVGPGSVIGGKPYVIRVDNPPRPAPAALMQKLLAPMERRGADAPAVTPDQPDAVDRAIVYLDEQAPLAVEGAGGDTTTFKVAAHLKDFGISEDMAAELMAEHWNDRCSPPWAVDDLKLKIRNAYEYGARPIGDLHPLADFKGVKAVTVNTEPRPARQWFDHGDARGKVDWLYWNVLPRVGVGVLLAESQFGKTFLAIHLAYTLATGAPFFSVAPDDKGATLFLFAGSEGSGFGLRLDALQAPGRLPIHATTVGDLAERDALPNLLEDLKAKARWVLAEFGVPVRLIVLETMASSGLLRDENDNAEASRAVANLAAISQAMNAFVLTSHHPDKAGKGARGASAIPNATDHNFEIRREGNIRTLDLTKARNAEQRQLGTFTLLPVELGKDDRGRPVTSMTVSTGEVMSTAVRAAPHFEKLVEAVGWATMESGEDVGDGRTGVEWSIARDMFKERKGGSGDRSNVLKQFRAAVAWGEQIGRIDVVPVGTEKFLVLRAPVEAPA